MLQCQQGSPPGDDIRTFDLQIHYDLRPTKHHKTKTALQQSLNQNSWPYVKRSKWHYVFPGSTYEFMPIPYSPLDSLWRNWCYLS